MRISPEYIYGVLNNYARRFPSESGLIDKISVILRRLNGLTYKESPQLHLTSSGLVFSPNGKHIAAVFHRGENAWLQPGGHLEQGEIPVAAARREVEEEMGIEAPAIWKWHIEHMCPIDIDIHKVICTANAARTEHVDFRYVFQKQLAGTENIKTKWFAIDEVVSGHQLSHISRALGKALRNGLMRDIKLQNDWAVNQREHKSV